MGKVHPKVDEAIETLNMRDNPTRRRLLAGTGLVSAAGAASALLAACSSSSSTHAAVASNGSNPFPAVPNQKYYFNNHADTNEFFTPTKYGYSDAVALLGLPAPTWGGSASSADSEMVSFMNTAISAKAGGIATSVIDSSMATPVKNAMDAGIPVVTYNADGIYTHGVPQIYTNRLAYVGQALYLSGQAMGEQIKTLVPGGGEIVIFIATPGTGNIQPRYDGAVSVLGSSYHVSEVATSTVDGTELSTEKSYLLGPQGHAQGRVRRGLRVHREPHRGPQGDRHCRSRPAVSTPTRGRSPACRPARSSSASSRTRTCRASCPPCTCTCTTCPARSSRRRTRTPA